ncbi:MAG: SpaA isopeptide-forming pilin-related protein [Bacilli bacterium]
MLKIKKIVAIVMLILLSVSSLQNIAYAVTFKQDVNIYQMGDCDYTLQYKRSDGVWSYVTCTYVVYKENGKTYPAYCLNRGSAGVGEYDNYDVNLDRLIDDVRLWRVAINGFPYKSASELGVYNDFDAFLATKQAVYSILYDNDVDTYYRGGNERGEKIHEAIKKMVYEGRYGTYTPQSANVTVNKIGTLQEDGNYYSQEYTVSSRVTNSQYTITNLINSPSGAYITDMNNNAKTTFNGGEHFKLRIPKSSMSSDINVKINVQAKCKTYPVFYGKTYIANTQNYLITSDPYGDEAGQGTLNLKTNNAKVIINKTDVDTNEPIPNTTFQLLKTDGTVVANATTNSKGVAEFTGLYQNNYILKEISSNEQYVFESNEQNFYLSYGQTKTFNITNKHKLGNLKVTKVDKDNNQITLGGVKFDLYSYEFDKVIGTYTTDANGEIIVKDLRIRKLCLD